MTLISRCTSVTSVTFSSPCRMRAFTWSALRLRTGSWGLRDYGTGSWAGGDPDCDHSVGGQVQQTKAGHDPNIVGMRPGVDASICRKCGATRTDRQLGLEPTPEAYVANMVGVFREVRRVLRRDGTVFLNIGDSYANDTKWGGASGEKNYTSAAGGYSRDRKATGLKAKDLVGIPWRLAFALQADGWYLRSEIIWAKPNPMPESVTDRPTKSHEQVFLLTRSPRYFYDADAVREPNETSLSRPGYTAIVGNRTDEKYGAGMEGRRERHGDNGYLNPAGRNLRSVWEIATQPYPEAHFATYPEALVERCVKAGTSERGCCPECGAPWEREVSATTYEPPVVEAGVRNVDESRGDKTRKLSGAEYNRQVRRETTGWRPSCRCGSWVGDEPYKTRLPVPCVVLDPFAGSGTTALVARNLERRSIAIELNETYAHLAAIRLSQQSLLTEAS